jgi:hypothetical protein
MIGQTISHYLIVEQVGGDTTKARTAYQNFLAFWRDADPDIPILKQAKAEYAKIR